MKSIFHQYPKAGVIYVMEQAAKKGFCYGNLNWSNLGQGSPELSRLPNSPNRQDHIQIPLINHGYAPVAGLKQLRTKLAEVYNQLFQQKFSHKNILIGGGGRLILSRIFASLGPIKVGYFLPDYASYEGIMDLFTSVDPVGIRLLPEDNLEVNLDRLRVAVEKHRIKALLLSNPTNPSGTVIKGEKLKALVELAKELGFYLILDEFYFNYIYQAKSNSEPNYVSAARYLKDVNQDPVIMVSGLSKAWRYPGWRVCWAIAPENLVENMSSIGSFLDGGANNPLQQAALSFVSKDNLDQETLAIQTHFRKKRDYMLDRLNKMEILVQNKPQGAFYIWADLSHLPQSIRTGRKIFQAGLNEKVIVVPGEFFDLNPHQLRKNKLFENNIRLSFSGSLDKIKQGMDGLQKVIQKARS